jgi:hypothetical protein
MYPGDRWTVGEPHDSSAAISRFEKDARQIADPALRPRTRRDVVDAKALIEAGQGYRRRLLAVSHPLLVRLYLARQCYENRAAFGMGRLANLLKLARLHVEPAQLFVIDLGQAFTFDLDRGLQPAGIPRDACDIAVALARLRFRFDWGGETLFVNGCFQENDNWKHVEAMAYPNRFFKYCNLLRRVDLGYELNWGIASKALLRRFTGE